MVWPVRLSTDVSRAREVVAGGSEVGGDEGRDREVASLAQHSP